MKCKLEITDPSTRKPQTQFKGDVGINVNESKSQRHLNTTAWFSMIGITQHHEAGSKPCSLLCVLIAPNNKKINMKNKHLKKEKNINEKGFDNHVYCDEGHNL